MSTGNTQKELQDIREEADTSAQFKMQFDENGLPVPGVAAVFADIYKDTEAGGKNKNGCIPYHVEDGRFVVVGKRMK